MTATLPSRHPILDHHGAWLGWRWVHGRKLVLGVLLVDLVVIGLTTVAAVASRESIHGLADADDVSVYVRVSVGFVVAGWIAVIAVVGGYRDEAMGAGTEEYRAVANASVLAAGCLGVGCYLTQFSLSRGFFVLEFLIGTPALLLGRVGCRRILHLVRRNGHALRRTLIVGETTHVDEIASVLRRERWLGYDVVGALSSGIPDAAGLTTTPGGIPVVGPAQAVAVAAQVTQADVVFFAGGAAASAADLRRTVWDLEPLALQLVVVPALTEVGSERIAVRPVAGLPLVHLAPPRAMAAGTWLKRTFDVVGAALLLVLTGPLLLASAVLIKLHDRGPVLFSQTRVGRDGELFRCWKLRTMRPGADQAVADLVPDGGNDIMFKIQDDPRVTRPGRLLRRLSVDELPQLWNVLRGEMSLVGPRPPLPREVERYSPDMRRRLRVRPGLTGLWQVSGRSDLSWEETVRLDLYYVENWSMVQDLAILARTVGAVLASRGAY